MKQIIRLSLLCAAFAGFSAVFGCDKSTLIVIDSKADKRTNKHNVRIYSSEMDSKQNVTTNISSNNTHVIKNFELPDSVTNVDINPSTSKSTKNLDDAIMDKVLLGKPDSTLSLSSDLYTSILKHIKDSKKPFGDLTGENADFNIHIKQNNASTFFYSYTNGEKVIIKVKLPNGSIVTYHFPD